jgi:hypothetical protein
MGSVEKHPAAPPLHVTRPAGAASSPLAQILDHGGLMQLEDDEELVAEIMPVLEIDHQYVRTVDGYDEHLAAQIRRCGRTAGRRLGYRVRTFASDPQQREDGRRSVVVVVTESTDQDETRVRERSELLMAETLTRMLG